MMTSRFYARVQAHRRNLHITPPQQRITAGTTTQDQQRARMIPIIGPLSGGGATPGTRPDKSRINRR